MGKRIKNLEAELAETQAALADSQERHRRATAHVNAHVEAERFRRAANMQEAQRRQDAERKRREECAAAERRRKRVERLSALRRGEVALTVDDAVSIDYERGAAPQVTLTLALDVDEAEAMASHVRKRYCRHP